MIVKNIISKEEAREKLILGVDKIANAVGSTLGARGRTVLIESEHHVGGITVTKDGVSVAKSINLMDPAENLAVMIMREASDRTATVAGDGTTTSMVIAQSLIHACMETLTKEDNLTQVLRDIQSLTDMVIANLDERSVKITNDKLFDVAKISANGDEEIARIIADAYEKVGLSGVVTVENSSTSETYSDVISGMKIDRGFASKYFVTDTKRQEAILKDPYIFVTDQTISNLEDILPILEFIMAGNRSLLIIGEMEPNVLNTLNLNKLQKGLKVCAIVPPQFGYKRHQLMEDISIATGAKYFSEKTGDNLALASIDDLGRASKIVVSRFNTLVFDAAGEYEGRVEELNEQLTDEILPQEKEFLKERIANLGGGVAVIKVGANSDIEQKEKKDRVDDAVCAVRAALEEGILPGGGVALKDESYKLAFKDNKSKAEQILRVALGSPMRKIIDNAEMDANKLMLDTYDKEGIGINVVTGAECDMMDMGIIDPTKVTKTALLNACSVATTLLSTDTVITNVRQM
jgi:chaperonin GroEL